MPIDTIVLIMIDPPHKNNTSRSNSALFDDIIDISTILLNKLIMVMNVTGKVMRPTTTEIAGIMMLISIHLKLSVPSSN